MRYPSIRYTYERCSNAVENRAWTIKFVREHNGLSQRAAESTASWVMNLQETAKEFVRIKHDGVLIAYARVALNEVMTYRVISDVYVKPVHRKKGHFHGLLPGLAVFTHSDAICLTPDKCRKHSDWYEVVMGWKWQQALPNREGGRLIYLTSDDAMVATFREAAKHSGGIDVHSQRALDLATAHGLEARLVPMAA